MRPVCRAETTRALDAAVISGLGVPGAVLMELAGRGAADAIVARFDRGTAAVLCGPGNNGGDGYVVARWLHLWGWRVRLVPVLPAKTDDAALNARLCRSLGIAEVGLDEGLAGASLVVDALLGTGQESAPRGAIAEAVAAARATGAPVVALDLPTCVHADTGALLGAPAPAALTVTFGRLKAGLCCAPGSVLAGEVVVVDIGLDLAAAHDPSLGTPDAWLVEAADVAAWLPVERADAAKWHRGHVAIRAGGGAGVLAAHAALRAGAGLATVLAPRSDWDRLHGLWPSVILAEPGALDPNRHDVVVVGPGMGTSGRLGDETLEIWSGFPGPVVADADALTLLAGRAEPPPSPRVITPHSAEAARLLGCTKAEVDADRFGTIAALRRFGTPLLKGPHTLVGDDVPLVNSTGSVRLATGGTGDVLSGVIGTLLARGLSPVRAAAAGAYLHGLAGEALPFGATADDLVEQLPGAFTSLEGP